MHGTNSESLQIDVTPELPSVIKLHTFKLVETPVPPPPPPWGLPPPASRTVILARCSQESVGFAVALTTTSIQAWYS